MQTKAETLYLSVSMSFVIDIVECFAGSGSYGDGSFLLPRKKQCAKGPSDDLSIFYLQL